ncbi:hypothetical protein ACFQ3Z_46155 [Streptomyces nogalater]
MGDRPGHPDEEESQPLIAEVFGIEYAVVAHLGWPHWLPGQDKPLPLGPHNAAPHCERP